MATVRKLRRFLNRLASKPSRLFCLGLDSVYDVQDSYVDRDPRCFAECMQYVEGVSPFDEDDGIAREAFHYADRRTADALLFGDSQAKDIWKCLSDLRMPVMDIFNPLTDDKLLLPGVTYKHRQLSAFTGTAELAGDEGDDDEEYEPKTSCPNGSEKPASSERTSCEPPATRVIRTNVLAGNGFELRRTQEQVPTFKTIPYWGSEPMRWVFEVSAPNMAQSVLDYLDQSNSSKPGPKKRNEPSKSVKQNMAVLNEFESWKSSQIRKRANVNDWCREYMSWSSPTSDYIEELLSPYIRKHDKYKSNREIARQDIVSKVIAAARAYRCRRAKSVRT